MLAEGVVVGGSPVEAPELTGVLAQALGGAPRYHATPPPGSRLVILAETTPAERVVPLATAAVRGGASVLDLTPSSLAKLRGLAALAPLAADQGVSVVMDGGARWGLTGILARTLAGPRGRLTALMVSVALAPGRAERALARRFRRERRAGLPLTYLDGQWRRLSARYYPTVVLPPPFGRRQATPVMPGDLRGVVDRLPSLSRAGLYFCEGSGFFLPAQGAGMLIEARGDDDQGLSLHHMSPAMLEAACAAACAVEILSGRETATLPQGLYADPPSFLKTLTRLGVTLSFFP